MTFWLFKTIKTPLDDPIWNKEIGLTGLDELSGFHSKSIDIGCPSTKFLRFSANCIVFSISTTVTEIRWFVKNSTYLVVPGFQKTDWKSSKVGKFGPNWMISIDGVSVII